MKVIFDKDKSDKTCGTVSSISFHNPVFKRAMEDMFGVKNYEVLKKVVINEDGIKAIIERKA